MNAQEQAAFNSMSARIKADPDIQKILTDNAQRIAATHDKGGSARDFQNGLRDQITNIAKRKGLIPDVGQSVFVNPNNGQLELHRGWGGLNNWQKAAIIGAGAAAGIGAGALLAGGGAAAAGAGGAGAATAGSGGAGMAGLATLGLPAGMAGFGTPVSIAAAGGIPGIGAVTGGSTIANLLGSKAAKGIGGKLLGNVMNGGLGRGVGAIGETLANNRGTELDAMMEADRNRTLLARDQRDADVHNLKQLRATNYIMSGGMPKLGPTKVNSGTLGQFNFGPAPISEADKKVASTLHDQLMQRMQNPLTPSDYDSKMKAGTGEKITNWLAPALDIFGPPQQPTNTQATNPQTTRTRV